MCDQPMRGHASQDTNCDGHKSSQAVSCCDQPTSQGVSCCDLHTSQGSNVYNDHISPHDYKLPPGADGEGLVRQQGVLDMDEEVGSAADWTYKKGSDESHNEYSFVIVDDMHTTDDDGPPPPPPDGPPPPPPPPAPPPPPPPALPHMPQPGPAVGAGTTVSGSRCVEPLNEFKNTHGSTVSAVAAPRSSVSCCDTADTSSAMMAAQYDGRTAIAQPVDVSPWGFHDQVPHHYFNDATAQGRLAQMHIHNIQPTSHISRQQGPVRKCTYSIINEHLTSQRVAPREIRAVVPSENRWGTTVSGSRCHDIAKMVLDETPPPQVQLAVLIQDPYQARCSNTHEEVQQHPQLLRGSDQQPPPQPRGERPSLRPPPLPPPAFTLEYFMNHVQIGQHWNQHDNALRHFRQLGRNAGKNSFILDERSVLTVPTKPDKRNNHSTEHWSGECTTWCWHELLAQLDDDSLRMVVEGSMNANGIALCKIREGSQPDSSRPSTADKTTSNGRDKEVLYRWEFAILRDNGTVAFLVPDGGNRKVGYYEGLPTDGVSAVATLRFRYVSDARTKERPECKILDASHTLSIVLSGDARNHPAPRRFHVEVPFPSTSSLTLTHVQTLKFMEHRRTNYENRGSALRPPQRQNMQPKR